MISFVGAERSHLAVMGEAEIVPATGQFKLFCDRSGIPAGLVRGEWRAWQAENKQIEFIETVEKDFAGRFYAITGFCKQEE
jgi:hypothetical protein